MTPLDQATFWRGQLGNNLALSAAATIMLDRAYRDGAPILENASSSTPSPAPTRLPARPSTTSAASQLPGNHTTTMTKQSVAANNAALALMALGTSEMTQCELSAAANLSRPRVSAALAYLTTINRIHISHWRMQGAYVRVFKAGAGVDAVRPSKAAEDREQLCSEILAHLHTGDMTVPELLTAIPRTNKIMLRLSMRLLKKTQRAHIVRYTNESRAAKPIWRFGKGATISRSSDGKPTRKLSPVTIPPPDPLMAALFGR